MTLTKRSTVLMVVFFVGLISLAADRTILRPQGGPGAVSAASESADPGLLSSNVPVLEDKPAGPNMARRLEDLHSGQEPDFDRMRDPFALPAAWTETPAVAERVPDAAALFIRTHQLTAVVINEQSAHALVNDRLLSPGGSLDGFTLVEVRDRTALFERDGNRVLLELIGK